jgi:cell division protease FtsH
MLHSVTRLIPNTCFIPRASFGDTLARRQKRELVAYHEAGHAVVGALIPDYDQVAKITITPRGGAGGLTFFAPNEDRVDSGLYSRQFLESQVVVRVW